MQKLQFVIGIDEAGRGPLAGPVSVGAALIPSDFDWSLLLGVNDSKQLSESTREKIFQIVRKLKMDGRLDYAVSMTNANTVDRVGINIAVNRSMHRALNRILKNNTIYTTKKIESVFLNITSTQELPVTRVKVDNVLVQLDGGLRAPNKFVYQETIIKGDAKEKIIGLASIMAKVTRDRYMRRRAKRAVFAPYDFATHKGYGTKAHRTAIAKYGISSEHRVTYCKNIKML